MDRYSDLLTVAQVAAILGCDVRTVRRWADDGTLPSARSPKDYRLFRRADIESKLAELQPK
jgi:excisionase family DNA binding protein